MESPTFAEQQQMTMNLGNLCSVLHPSLHSPYPYKRNEHRRWDWRLLIFSSCL